MNHPTFRIVLAALSLLVALTAVPAALAQSVPENDAFARTWSRHDLPVLDGDVDRTWMWGEGFTGAMIEAYEDSPDGRRTVQYFDKARMEISNPEANPDELWYVSNGLLVVEMFEGQIQVGHAAFVDRAGSEPPHINVAGDLNDLDAPTYATLAGLRYEPPFAAGAAIIQRVDRNGLVTTDAALAEHGVTAEHLVDVPGIRHRVASPFWNFVNSSGPIWEDGELQEGLLFPEAFYATGLPLTEAYWATVSVAGTDRDVLTQCFERRCLTYTPDNPEGWQVEAGNVGQHYYEWRYGHEPILGFAQPHGVAVDGENVYVASGRNNRIVHFTTDGAYVTQWGGGAAGQFDFPTGVAADGEGFLYIAENLGHRVSKYTTGGEFVTSWGSVGSGPGQFTNPYGIAVGPDGLVYVSDHTNGRVQRFTTDGEYVSIIGAPGAGDGQLAFPGGLAFDLDGNLLVADIENDRIQRFSPDGAYLGQWGGLGNMPGQFDMPRGVAVASDGTIIVTDAFNDRIQRFNPEGEYLGAWPLGHLSSIILPFGLALDADGNVFMTDGGEGEVYKFASDGTLLTQLTIASP